MKIVMVTPFYHPIIGGTERVIEDLAIELNKFGTSVDVMTFNVDRNWKPWSLHQVKRGKTEKINGVKIIKIPALTFLPSRILLQANFIPWKFVHLLSNYDVIHFHNDVDLSFPLFSSSVNKPKILHLHCLDVTYNIFKKMPLQKLILKRAADSYIVPSAFDLETLINLGIPAERATVIPNCIDVKKFHPAEEGKIKNLLLFVGRIHQKKGLDTLLNALRYLKTTVKLVIIGPPSQQWFLKEVISLIDEINRKTPHKVVYLGIQKIEEIIKWYQRAQIFVCPSLSEPFGIVNLEAMACSTPVVATRVGGIPEVVKDCDTGIIVPPNNAAKLAESIQHLLDNERFARKLGRQGRAWVVETFSSEVIAKKLIRVYESFA